MAKGAEPPSAAGEHQLTIKIRTVHLPLFSEREKRNKKGSLI